MSQQAGRPVSLFFLVFFWRSLCPNESAVGSIMLTNVSLPSYMMIHVKRCQDILYGLGVLTNKVTANITQKQFVR